MTRPRQIPVRPALTEPEIAAARYVGSPEHKAERWWGGVPQARIGRGGEARRPKKEHTSICPKVTSEDREQASHWVREALRHRQFRFFEGDKLYPKHIWYKDQAGQYWFGFAINQIAGTYKGWPISEAERRENFD